jgi:hypothetical protein
MADGGAWAAFERLQDRDVTLLTADELALVSVGSLRQEVNSGGFDCYFRYGGGDSAQSAVQAAVAMGSPELSALLIAAMSRLGDGPYPLARADREERIDDLDLDFEDLDEAYNALEVSVDLDAQMALLAQRLT